MTAQTTTPVHTLRLVLGDQLHIGHSWFAQPDTGVVYTLMEVRQETDYVLHHAQKVLAIFAAMRAFAQTLRDAGHRVRYVTIDDPSNRQRIDANLEALASHYGAACIETIAPDEWRLDEALRTWGADWARRTGGRFNMVDSEHFLCARDDVARTFAQRRQWLMEHFYRQMRRRYGVLMDSADTPAGGQWNYDHDNREPWRGDPPELPDNRPVHDLRALWATIEAAGVKTFGSPNAETLRWPLTRGEALEGLHDFVQRRLPHFGRFEDAMHSQAQRLFHSLLSFALNIKLLHPREVIAAAEQAWRDGQVPLAAAEGFIRQILGWREYVRGIYWAQMPGYDERNALGHNQPLPDWFWTGRTRMRCLSECVGASLQNAYAHHIQRLMVIGNFALLAGLSPQAVHRWYLGVYIDAFEWVELPNTLGMSQFADGGLLATKPYVSSAAYIDRMSDYCKGCAYDRKARTGEGACPFNALYWDFFARHEARLGRNARVALVYRQLDRMRGAELDAVRERAAQVRAQLDAL
ncbi:cryptochrome/photolyase family protein [Acidovorax lacteus]|uniref:Cryptochrome/photolyase family protein n=1 Tax=Acidovorax lacteus TaxID=1924988 RepID=A0ABP8LIZ6_9BURK